MDSSTSTYKKAASEVTDLVHDSKIFLESFRGHADTNATKVNASVDSLTKSLQEETTKFDSVRTALQDDHSSFLTSVASRLDKLQADLAMENRIMDELAHLAQA